MMYKLDLEKAEEQKTKLPTSIGSQRKQENSRKISTSASLTTLKPLTVWIKTNWKILKEMGIPDHLTCLWETCMQVKKQQLEPGMEQRTGFKLGKEYVKAVYSHPAYLTSMQSTENYGQRFVTLYRRQKSRPSPWKRNAKKQNGCLGRP